MHRDTLTASPSHDWRHRLAGDRGHKRTLGLPEGSHIYSSVHPGTESRPHTTPRSQPWLRLQVADVGGGTGFCTLGVVKTVDAKNVTLIDQSPHQLAKAKAKPALKDVTILEVTPPPPNPTPKIVSRSSSPTSRVEGRDALW